MMRALDPGPPDCRRRTIAVVAPTLWMMSLEETALQAQRECEKAWWVAEVRGKNMQLAVLLEERRMLAALLKRERDQRYAERRSVALAREQEKALWTRLTMDGLTVEKRNGMMANAKLTPMMSSQDHGQNLPSSSAGQHASMTAHVIKGYARGLTAQAQQLRPVARSDDGGAVMNEGNTTYHNAITDMMKAHRQEALRQELLRKEKRRSEVFAREQKALWSRLMMDGVANAVEKRIGMMANAKFTPMMSSQDHGQNLPSSSAGQHASITAHVIKGYTRGLTGQAQQLRPVARSDDGGAVMNEPNTTYHNATTDMMKAHRQEALRQELMEKQRVREREAEAAEAAEAGVGVRSRLLRFWNLLRKSNCFGNRRRRHAASQD